MTGSGPTDAPLLAGRYAIGDPIGRGRSTVHRATDTRLRRQVAIKEVRLAEAQEAVEQVRLRATREAQAAARLNNPGVVTVYDVVEERGSIWLVMELVEAPSLAQIVGDEGPLTHPRAARIGQGVVSALQAAHAVGIVHRDVKPANVLVMIGDRTKLADFGVATIRDESRVTATGTIVGSPSYMAPEQAMAADVGPFTDLWALGATLYFAVEGVPPFVGDSPLATASAVVHGDPRPPRNRGPLTSLLMRLLDKDAARRPTARQVRVTLSAIAGPGTERRDDTLVARSPLARSPARGAGGDAAGRPAPASPSPRSRRDPRRIVIPGARRKAKTASPTPPRPQPAAPAEPAARAGEPPGDITYAAPLAGAGGPGATPAADPAAPAGTTAGGPSTAPAAPPTTPGEVTTPPADGPSAAPPEAPAAPAGTPADGPSGTSATEPAAPAEALTASAAPAANLAEATLLPDTPAADPPRDAERGAPAGTTAEDDLDGPTTTTAPPGAAPAGASDSSPPAGSDAAGAATADPGHGDDDPPAGTVPDALPSTHAASATSGGAVGAPDRDESPPRVDPALAGSAAAAGSGPADDAAAPASGTPDDERDTRANDGAVAEAPRRSAGTPTAGPLTETDPTQANPAIADEAADTPAEPTADPTQANPAIADEAADAPDDDAAADASRGVAGAPAASPLTEAAADPARTDTTDAGTAVAGTAAEGASGESGPGARAGERVAALGTDARRRWAALGPQRQRVIVAVAVLVLLAVTIWALAGGGGGDEGGTETGGGSGATTETTAETGEASAEAPSGGEGDATTTTAAVEQGGDVPDGWTAYQDPTAGYTIAHPAGWRVEPADGPRIDIRDPATGSYLRIDWTDEPRPDPVADWRTQSERFASGHDAYREIRIEPYEYRDYNAAVWEFTYRDGGADLHVANLGFVAGPRGYALYFQTPEDQWSASQDTFASFRETFRPSS